MVPELKMFALKLALVLVVFGLLSTVVEVESKCYGYADTVTPEKPRAYREPPRSSKEEDYRDREAKRLKSLGIEKDKYFYGGVETDDKCSSRLVLTKDFYRFFR